MKFFRLQMTIHHPRGAKTQETGAFSVDQNLWQVIIICDLYCYPCVIFRGGFLKATSHHITRGTSETSVKR